MEHFDSQKNILSKYHHILKKYQMNVYIQKFVNYIFGLSVQRVLATYLKDLLMTLIMTSYVQCQLNIYYKSNIYLFVSFNGLIMLL